MQELSYAEVVPNRVIPPTDLALPSLKTEVGTTKQTKRTKKVRSGWWEKVRRRRAGWDTRKVLSLLVGKIGFRAVSLDVRRTWLRTGCPPCSPALQMLAKFAT